MTLETPPTDELAFAARAREEAARYGSDPWVFVRELLQNSRDAGATRIAFHVCLANGWEEVSCADDGEGLSFADARRFLFSLYASSKESATNQAGRFGVGFWSILRFQPETICVESSPRMGSAWGIELDGDLTRAQSWVPPETPDARQGSGMRVLLRRRQHDDALERRVKDAVEQSARDLRQRDELTRRITITINGRSANRPLWLPAPSSRFRRGAVRGVVALGAAPAVELFSQGLRVRSATALSDLLASGRRSTTQTRVHFSELVDGVAPQAMLEGGRLDLTMARSDAHETRALTRLVQVANRELSLLVEKQLDRVEGRRALRRAVVPVIGVLAATAMLGYAWSTLKGRAIFEDGVATRPPSRARLDPSASTPSGYRDLERAYEGPAAAVAGGSARPAHGPLRYSPADRDLYIAALRVAQIDSAGRPVVAKHLTRTLPTYTCSRGCVDIALVVADGPGELRVPLPTGHALEPKSLRLDSGRVTAVLGAEDQPLLELDHAMTGTLRYRTGPAPFGSSDVSPSHARARLPPALATAAESLRTLEPERRVQAAVAWVADAVRYSDQPLYAQPLDSDVSFVARALRAGAGDCDVQNTVLMALLRDVPLQARLAVGYVGRDGVTLERLHAWVEYREPDGPWRVADASLQRPPHTPTGPARPGVAAALSPLSPLSSPSPPSPPSARSASAPKFLQWASIRWAAGRSWLRNNQLWMIGVGLLLGTLLCLWARRTRVERTLDVQARPDLTALLSGALQRPDAFRETPSVFQRPLLWLTDGKRISLADAWQLSHRGQLYVSKRPSSLLDEARRCGARVLDAGRPEGRAVAEMLGAISLDTWHERLHGARTTGLLRAASEHLDRHGERWTLRALPATPPGNTAVPSNNANPGSNGSRVLEIIGRTGGRVSGYALVDSATPAVANAEALSEVSPALALFKTVDGVAELLGIPAPRRATLLAPLAREALLERA